jgi:dTDP-D-glucose 4,6-dehydratase
LGHGAVLIVEGRLEFKTDQVKQVVEMIEKAHAESEEGTFVPSKDMDELNYVLQSKEHPVRTCGYENRPWKHTLKSTVDSYAKRENMMSYLRTRYKKRCRTFCRLRGKKCMSHFKGI